MKGKRFPQYLHGILHSVLKRELIYLERFNTRAGAIKRIFEYIEIWYNRKRIRTSIGYHTPDEFCECRLWTRSPLIPQGLNGDASKIADSLAGAKRASVARLHKTRSHVRRGSMSSRDRRDRRR
ncbi:IS3 family transposase [Alicyclobacillus fructus]|uniref:IS3 family transposase n=1 Tax=Alicyclobacillus fructus TaxID=2816082 RepID=UPI001A8E5939